MMRILFILIACCLPAFASAQAVYKCTDGGKTSYSDRPCAHGASSALPPAPSGISPGDAMGPQGGDARTLLELEKARMAREKTQAKDEREQARLAKGFQSRRRKCEKLRLRHQWAKEDLARTVHGPKQEAARVKAQRQAETLAVECPA